MVTEREKMLAGDPYNAYDEELVALRMKARRLLYVYNNTTPDEPDRRTAILRDLFGTLKKPVEIEPPFYCDYGSNIHAGERLYMNFGCVVLDCGEIRIGDGSVVVSDIPANVVAAGNPCRALKRL